MQLRFKKKKEKKEEKKSTHARKGTARTSGLPARQQRGAKNTAGPSLCKKKCLEVRCEQSEEGFCRRGRERSFHRDGPKTEKAQEPRVKVWCEESGG